MSKVTRLLHQFIHGTPHNPHCHVPRISQDILAHRPFQFRVTALSPLTHTHISVARRTFSSSPITRAALRARKLEGEPTVLAARPSPDMQEEIDLVPEDQAKLLLTRRAAEQLQSIAVKKESSDIGLRVRVDSGGCHGYQYAIELAEGRHPDDYVFSHTELKPSNVYIDAVSLTLMKGSIIDFATELIGSSFRVNDNPQAKGSGCGCGVSWELKDDVVL